MIDVFFLYFHTIFYYFNLSINSSSVNKFIFNSCALVNLEPALSPYITKSVFLDTCDDTLAPSCSNNSFILFLV